MREVAGIEFVHLQETPAVLAALDALLARHLANQSPAAALIEQARVAQEREKRRQVKAAVKENSKSKRLKKEEGM